MRVHRNTPAWPRGARAAFTLIELMVVVVVVLLLTMVTIRVVVPNTEARRVREAARMVDAFIHGARARAIQTGRPFGVQIVPRPEDGKAFVLEYVQVPEPYAGDMIDSRAKVISNDRIEVHDIGWQGIVHKGDTVQLNHTARMYTIDTDVDNLSGTGPWVWELLPVESPVIGGIPYRPDTWVAYKVLRSPIKAGGELELPQPAVIDTLASGVGDAGVNAGTIRFLFSPGGSLTSVYTTATGWRRPTQALYLGIGKVENDRDTNLIDLETYWVSISHQTGLVVAAESAGVGSSSDPADQIVHTRRFVRDKLSLGSL